MKGQPRLADHERLNPSQTTRKTQPSIELHVGEVVLRGVASGDRHRIGQAMQRELARLFAEQGVPDGLVRGGHIERLEGGAFEMTPDSRAEAIGAQVAQAVYGGLAR